MVPLHVHAPTVLEFTREAVESHLTDTEIVELAHRFDQFDEIDLKN